MNEDDTRGLSLTTLILIALSLAGIGVGYVTSIVIARLLGPEDFEDYAVSIAMLGLLSVVAESGVGKYALRVMPKYVSARDWSLANGYCRFSLRLAMVISVALAVIVGVWEGAEDASFWDYPLGIAVLFLPAAALAGIGVDFVMANRAYVRASVVARLVIPCSTLAALTMVASTGRSMNTAVAIVCYGVGSTLGAVSCAVLFYRTSEREVLISPPQYEWPDWLKQSWSFLVIGFLISWTFRIPIVILELLPIPELEVGLFAAAIETGCLILLVSKSIDKMFQPAMSNAIDQHDRSGGVALRRSRWLIVGIGCAGFLTVIFLAGRLILGWYGPEYDAAYPALCWIALGACIWTMFSLAPVYLEFIGRNRLVLTTTICGAVAMAALTTVLGFYWHATGAGIAFCAVLSTVAAYFFIVTSRHLNVLDAEPATSSSDDV